MSSAWRYQINVRDLWTRAKAGHITAAKLGQLLAARLRGQQVPVPPHIRWGLESLEQDATFDDFDVVLKPLYNWADDSKTLWISTF